MIEKRQQNILITGTSGDLGRELSLFLEKQDFGVARFSRASRLEDISLPIDAVIDCATNYGRNRESYNEIAAVNITRPLQLLEWAKSNGVKKWISCDTALPENYSDYARTKNEFRNHLRQVHSITTVSLRMEHFYGGIESPHKFLAWFIEQLIQNKSPIPLTEGRQKRNFVHLKDVLNAFLCILKADLAVGYYEFELGSSDSIELREILTYLQNGFKKTHLVLDFGAVPYRTNEVMHSRTNLEPLQKLGWKPNIEIKEGLDMLIELYKNKAQSK